ncbi:UDP-N-acetylmuramoyl-tripeptide--D-alanyl-D-alanine ligase [Acidipropionibacterium jensenii]|uniref:UDP-N-acetylmuramoyl-tripeptide--D-alanyl-D- alanine ligase n=1 Tax=Acidipropionibacterium jensenii TaxID=1749 RepID=UPI00110B7C02|nr:UDP-N-acetylmuramoyl-tripeptide--D-alanyl-D-alanine ligase [Acidipropionibacterium jensenii]MDN5976539.1 UDP-N-acetylmuramoyl-tripeptide--D-alanyl-D-alanine ligase [Acidipropionibacterium jensenii]MDN5995224.1 UDP-N-acetylmuramoyl-tripeptide--D-alanyl-D-alanine ligase [Acidipropionibacterium jensenii]MDN6426809.1 UDP-N-acetylmuramoyl-tripeptide--D-alanyl-D-alanine ligase [Acidipropionibacterium jensenii]MDN6440666.1 UDP-N-acetylmuramoyl-tripeptide--D-alanyl-D-alanine ligase [Acidipropionibac
MRILTTSEIAAAIGARLSGEADTPVGPRVVIDTRLADRGSLFVALPGERVDGHDFTGAAARAGAAAVLATRLTDADLPHLVVSDSQQGLTDLARHLVALERARGMRAVALTGSSGKTSTKDILAQVLDAAGATVSPVGSFNNEIGVPLTACGIDEKTDFLVSEMGARGKGHIAWLTSIVPPDVAMVLNVGTAHLGEFGSRDAIAAAKGEIVEALEAGGWAVLNAADHRVAAMTSRTAGQIAWFSPDDSHRHPGAAIEAWADQVSYDDLERHSFTLHLRSGGTESAEQVRLRTMGAHQVANAVAAAAAAACCGMDAATIAARLSAATSRSPWRMELDERRDGLVVVNDCYNANPDSMRAALDALSGILSRRRGHDPATRGIAVLGEMRELGPSAPQLHREAGRQAARAGFDLVLCLGEHAADLAGGVAEGGVESRVVDATQVAGSVDWFAHDVVLVKASRTLRLERVAAEILDDKGGRA